MISDKIIYRRKGPIFSDFSLVGHYLLVHLFYMRLLIQIDKEYFVHPLFPKVMHKPAK